MAEKRYYWLKLKEDYFTNPKIKKLRKIAGGDTFTIIYLKMQLLSVSNQGVIEFEGIENTFEEELALKLDEDLDNVQLTLAYLKAQCLVETNNNEYLLVDACNNIGSECDSAKRVRDFREKKNKMLQCNNDVTPVLQNSISISNSNSNNINIYKEVIDYLNEKAGTHYRQVESNYKHIKARLQDFSVEDLKTVIDKKCQEWIGTEFEKYLTPETLFRPGNFEKYLNQNIRPPKLSSTDLKAAHKREYTKEQLDALYDNLEEVEI